MFSCQNFPRPIPKQLPHGFPRRFGEIRDVANSPFRHFETQENQRHREFSLQAVIDKLCWLALHGGTKAPPRDSEGNRTAPPPNPGLDLLSAATYFGCGALVRNLPDQGHDTSIEDLFPPPCMSRLGLSRPRYFSSCRRNSRSLKIQTLPRISWDFAQRLDRGPSRERLSGLT